ncbi:hypothetical protein GCM10022254_23540 [Actinomadura meridiana]|uniref:HTH merR-type domain-containing protein n=1 Tax=Actinomadura meridiana TaxID=559626 RepID=A0ABP8BXU1_9ACTN
MPLLTPEEDPRRERWGWIAVLHCESGEPWIPARHAARACGISTASLRRWAERGVISVIRDPGQHRHYYSSEIAFLAAWVEARKEAGKEALSLIALTNYIEFTLASPYYCEST